MQEGGEYEQLQAMICDGSIYKLLRRFIQGTQITHQTCVYSFEREHLEQYLVSRRHLFQNLYSYFKQRHCSDSNDAFVEILL